MRHKITKETKRDELIQHIDTLIKEKSTEFT